MATRTDTERRQLLQAIAARRTAGASLREALAAEGLAASTYYAWRRKFGEAVAADDEDTLYIPPADLSPPDDALPAGAAPRSLGGPGTERAVVISTGNWSTAAPPVDIDDPQRVPLCGICLIRSQFGNGQRQAGTGWFINTRTVVTAGHILFDPSPGRGLATRVWLAPAFSMPLPDPTPIGEVEVGADALRVPDRWQGQQDPRYDVGGLKLPDERFAGHIHPFRFLSPSDAVLYRHTIRLAGYPVAHAPRQRLFTGEFEEVHPKRVFYRLDTSAGMSGSPIWIYNRQGEPIAVALHTGLDQLARGVRIDPEVKGLLQQWMG